MQRIEVWEGNITKLAVDGTALPFGSADGRVHAPAVDAIVNAANTSLLGGGGVDGAIHRAAGKELLEECRALRGCRVGEAKITRGYKLPARHVIHTVGPRYRVGDHAAQLASCYRKSLELARQHQLHVIAFPAISTGVYGYPMREATEIAVRTIQTELASHELPHKVILCTFDAEATRIATEVLAASL